MKCEKIIRIGVLSEDVYATVEHYKNFGFKNWKIEHFDSNQIPVMAMKDSGNNKELRFIGAMYDDEHIHMEVLQPLSEGVFMDWLKEHGTGVYHIEMKPAGDARAFIKECREKGYESCLDVSFKDGEFGFTYFDTFKLMGFNVEVHF